MILVFVEVIKNIKSVVVNKNLEDIDVKRSYNIYWSYRITNRYN